jgi:hypothetical protein
MSQRFCEIATLTPQTILYKFARYYPAGTAVNAATSQSRWDVVCKRGESAVDNDEKI